MKTWNLGAELHTPGEVGLVAYDLGEVALRDAVQAQAFALTIVSRHRPDLAELALNGDLLTITVQEAPHA